MISAVIHTYNEEKNIDRCLSSLSWMDEIVLIDMGSTDKTRTIATSYKANIYHHSYTGFVEPARNFGIEKSKGDWILIIDADEELPKTLVDLLLTVQKDDRYDFYRIARKNFIFGKWIQHGGWWPDYQVRFFRKGAVSWSDKIHGLPLTIGRGMDLEVSGKLCLVHHNYQTIEQYIGRLNRYTSISAKELYLDNKRVTISNFFIEPAREFVSRYFVWEGYKDGLYGLALSLLQSSSELVVYLKLWELENYKQQKVSISEIDKLITSAFKLKKYWLLSGLLNQSQTSLKRFWLHLKRKILTYG